MEVAVKIENLSFTYLGNKEPTLQRINLEVREREIASIIGLTGAGKSTLLMCLNGLIPHLVKGTMEGKITISGMDTRAHDIPELAQKIGMVFQDPEVQLFSLTVKDELAFGPENLGLPKEEIKKRIAEAVKAIRLEPLLKREPARLSGGQQQSVVIGAIWTMLPDILVLDEPTSNLDPRGSRNVLSLIQRLNQEFGKTILLVDHRVDEVAEISDRVLVMHDGKIVLDGTPHEVFQNIEFLHELGLMAPSVTELTYRIWGKSRPLPITIDEAVIMLASDLNQVPPGG